MYILAKKEKRKKTEKKEKKVINETAHFLKLPLPLRRGRKTYFSLLFNFLKFWQFK
jgi:hypothetical protein